MDDEGLEDAKRTAIATGRLPIVRVRRNYGGDMIGSGCPLCGTTMKQRDFLADIANRMGVVTVHFECFKHWQTALLGALTQS